MYRIIPFVALAVGCLYVKVSEDVDSFAVDEPITRLVVDLDSGGVDVVADGGDRVVVTRTFTWSNEAPEATWQVSGSTLTLRADCPDLSMGPCSVDHAITVPGDVEVIVWTGSGGVDVTGTTGPVDIETGSGSVSLYAITGEATVSTGSGSIDLDGVTGSVSLETGSGSIDGRDLSGAVAVVDTGSGSVDLRLVAPVSRVEVDTGSGGVDLMVPTGAYRVDVSTGSGGVDFDGITIDDDAPASLIVSTGSGGVSVVGR